MGLLKRMWNEERGRMMRDVEYDVGPAQILTILFCCNRPVVTWEETERHQWDPSLPKNKRVYSSLSLLFRARAPLFVLVGASWFVYSSSKSEESASY